MSADRVDAVTRVSKCRAEPTPSSPSHHQPPTADTAIQHSRQRHSTPILRRVFLNRPKMRHFRDSPQVTRRASRQFGIKRP
ncbi:hypothetical protein CURTO8I2_220048 [Curtobacterium sp. 8I-2]|nr:hypothetical protein CURTO8I2_220048 [Curtobacterium sp. 8I-2]